MATEKSRASDNLETVELDNPESGPAGPDGNQSSNGSKTQESSDDSDEGDKITVEMDPALAQKLRSAVYYTPGLTMYQAVAKGVEVVLKRVAEEHHDGQIPHFEGNLEGGRPPQDAPEYEF